MNLDETLTRAIAVRDELTKAIEQAQTKDEWPKVVGVAWYTVTTGVERGKWASVDCCEAALARGNVYRTQAAAERADQRRIVDAELRRMARAAGPVGDEWWYVVKNSGSGWTSLARMQTKFPNTPRFPTRASAEAAIAAITPERLDLLLDEGE